MKLAIKGCLIGGTIFILLGLATPVPPTIGADFAVKYFRAESSIFAARALDLKNTVSQIKTGDTTTIEQARMALAQCRYSYKRIEFLLEYFFKSAALVYNAPAKYETEEPEMAYVEPIGLQVIESLLFAEDVESSLPELIIQSDVITSSAGDLQSLFYHFEPSDQQILESLQIDLVRVVTLGVAGFDAPLLKSGINESFASLTALQDILQPYLAEKNNETDSTRFYLESSLAYLKTHTDFDSFDRLSFMTKLALPLRHHLNLFIRLKHLEINTGNVLNYDTPNLFSRDALNIMAFVNGGDKWNNTQADLGKMLFAEPLLSGNHLRSCATCHQPGKFFTDALPKSLSIDNHSSVKRNAPTLLYAGYQYAQFWDGRAKTLEDQVKMVIISPGEMNGDYDKLLASLQKNQAYVGAFSRAFPATKGIISIDNVATAIAMYIRTLNPMNSAFDRYVNGDTTALTVQQKKGFNLFMGKAQCGTCHFAPLFNGLVPPLYLFTELEVAGTPKTDNLDTPEKDSDAGRFAVFPIEFNQGAFKTPTVRNAAVTAPYMHNGAFHSLEKVMAFYNLGGGQGMGLSITHQTLSPKPLGLSSTEIDHIISFLGALTDEMPGS